MYCLNENERIKHPEAKLIPQEIWIGEFHYSIPDQALHLMRMDLPVLMKVLNTHEKQLRSLNKEQKFNYLLAMAYKVPLISDDTLMTIAKIFDIGLEALFQSAACTGRLALFEKIVDSCDKNILSNLIKAQNYLVFCLASRYGQLPIIERLIALVAEGEAEIMIKADNYRCFSLAALNGHKHIMDRIISVTPQQLETMIFSNNYASFRAAGKYGQLAILEWLKANAATKFQQMIRHNSYCTFRYAVENGHSIIMEWLINELSEDIAIEDMLCSNENEAFRLAVLKGHDLIISRLLSCPAVFVFATENAVYQPVVSYFISVLINDLKSLKQSLALEHPEQHFDLDDNNDAILFFYIIKHLIKSNHRAHLQDIEFLLNIPAIACIAHHEGQSMHANELLQLALYYDNQALISHLLNIPTVRAIATAQDKESSIKTLNQSEEKRLNSAINHYRPAMQDLGIEHGMHELRQWLATRYQANPAKIIINNATINLPLEWIQFDALNLQKIDKAAALKAYYQSKDHSAWRYLQKPNPWMHEAAEYINSNDANPEQKWSTFEAYQELIILLWLAAKDSQSPAINGHTLIGREIHFVNELALIGRAHNWDNTRIIATTEEEYDDLEADRPSCYSGVKRRLFQSVVGHPLLDILTKDELRQEICEFVRAHFISHITAANRQALETALNAYFINLDEEIPPIILSLNIQNQRCENFIHTLEQKYGEAFSDDPQLIQEAKNLLLLKESGEHIECSHALKFTNMVNLMQILKAPLQSSVATLGFFAATSIVVESSMSSLENNLTA